jgi:hypothetical protein
VSPIEQPKQQTRPVAQWFFAICPQCFKLLEVTHLRWPSHPYGVNILGKDIPCPLSAEAFE